MTAAHPGWPAAPAGATAMPLDNPATWRTPGASPSAATFPPHAALPHAAMAPAPAFLPYALARRAFIGLGANLGEPVACLQAALRALATLPQLQLVRHSALYGSAPVDAGGGDYTNAVAEVATTLAPLALLHVLQELEQAAGRTRPYRNAPRTLDLDLLLFDGQTQHDAELTLPHPRMWERAFVLLPLAEIAPDLVPAEQLRAVQQQAVWRL